MEEVAISVSDVYKDFLLPHERVGTVKGIFTGSFKRRKNSSTQHALKDIKLEIKKGEFFGIVGRNGSGKSTLLKMLAGIYQPSKGSIRVNGKLVPFIELGVGFNPELTGRENVYLNGAMLGFSKAEVDAMYDDIVSFAELKRFMDQKLKNYSSGMQVRLAFSMAIRAQADILLVDEVLAVGDADFQRKCFQYFRKLKKNKKTVVFVTHDMSAVREYCDRGALIDRGKLVAVGKPDKIATLYEQVLAPSTAESTVNETPSERWGDDTVNIESAKISNLNAGEITFKMRVRANKKCDNLILGFVVKNDAGVSLVGTNTTIEKIKVPVLYEAEHRTLTWTLPNIFADGNYTITLATSYDSGRTISDWWEDACSFRIVKAIHTPFLVAPKIIASWSEDESI